MWQEAQSVNDTSSGRSGTRSCCWIVDQIYTDMAALGRLWRCGHFTDMALLARLRPFYSATSLIITSRTCVHEAQFVNDTSGGRSDTHPKLLMDGGPDLHRSHLDSQLLNTSHFKLFYC